MFDSAARIETELVRDHVARVCFLVPGLHIKLHDKRSGGGKPEEFVAAGGLADYVDFLSSAPPVTDIISFHADTTFEEKVPVNGKMTTVTRPCTVDVAARWVQTFEPKVVSFVNTIPTSEGGTHVAGFDRALLRTVNERLLGDAKKLKKLAKSNDDRASGSDAQEGLVAALKVTFPEPQFKGQTKQELGTPQVQSLVYETVKAGLSDWMDGGGKKLR